MPCVLVWAPSHNSWGQSLLWFKIFRWKIFSTSGLLQNCAKQCNGNLLGVKLTNVTRAMCTFCIIWDMCTEKHWKLRMLYIIHLWCNFDREIFEIVHIVHIVQIVNDTWCTFDGEKHRGNFAIWLGPLRRPLETLLISPLNHHHLFSHYFSPYFSPYLCAKPSSSFLSTKP